MRLKITPVQVSKPITSLHLGQKYNVILICVSQALTMMQAGKGEKKERGAKKKLLIQLLKMHLCQGSRW